MAALTDILARAEIDYAHLPYDVRCAEPGAGGARAGRENLSRRGPLSPVMPRASPTHLGFDGVVTPADLAAGDKLPFDRASIDRIDNRAAAARA